MGYLFYCYHFVIHNVEGQSIFKSIRFSISHLPTFFLVIGYPIYWLELYIFRAGYGKTTPLAWIIFSAFVFIVFFQNYSRVVAGARNFRAWFAQQSLSVKLLLICMGIGAGVILLCAFYASLLPPHLGQEFDALNYHITLPRQHLLRGSFGHIPWSTADLFLLPIDFALTPFWLATSLPNKLPQFFFVLGLLGVCGRLAWRFSGGKVWPSVLLILAVLGSHNIGIQMGTAMLDICLAYLFFAALDSFLNRAIGLGVIELSFYVWSKSFMPIQIFLILIVFGAIWLFMKFLGIRKAAWVASGEEIKVRIDSILSTLRQGISLFLLVSLFVAGPFIYKSLCYSGTPLFPFGVGILKTFIIPQAPERWAELKLKATQHLGTKDQYGTGRSFLDFLRHFWLVAVPEKGVNNRYDYPLGLMYLLFLGPFMLSFFTSLRQKILPLLSLWVVVSWGIWWLGSQQTRFLYAPLILMYLAVVPSIRVPSRVLLGVMLGAILLVSASVYRANKQDLGRWGETVLRPQDKELVQFGKFEQATRGGITLPFFDVAYATFPVEVVDIDSRFVLKTVSGDGK